MSLKVTCALQPSAGPSFHFLKWSGDKGEEFQYRYQVLDGATALSFNEETWEKLDKEMLDTLNKVRKTVNEFKPGIDNFSLDFNKEGEISGSYSSSKDQPKPTPLDLAKISKEEQLKISNDFFALVNKVNNASSKVLPPSPNLDSQKSGVNHVPPSLNPDVQKSEVNHDPHSTHRNLIVIFSALVGLLAYYYRNTPLITGPTFNFADKRLSMNTETLTPFEWLTRAWSEGNWGAQFQLSNINLLSWVENLINGISAASPQYALLNAFLGQHLKPLDTTPQDLGSVAPPQITTHRQPISRLIPSPLPTSAPAFDLLKIVGHVFSICCNFTRLQRNRSQPQCTPGSGVSEVEDA